MEKADGAPLAAHLVGGDDESSGSGSGSGTGTGSGGRQPNGSYSRFVTWMKVVLPFFALGLIALIVIWPHLKTDNSFRIGFASVSLRDDAASGMDNARYVGTDDKSEPYSVTADLARIVSKSDGTVDLELPKADLTLSDGTWLVLTANTGHYERENATLDLRGDVNLFHDAGYEISTEKLLVDLNAGSAVGHEPLTGHGPFGELKSAGLKLIDKGAVIDFTGPAQLILFTASGDKTPDKVGRK
jgi:lipopolysaccharide export system protein LptC